MFNRILVPTDFSEPSDAALQYARTLAAKFGASLHLFHVVEDQFVTGPFGAEMYVPHPPGTLSYLTAEAQGHMNTRISAEDRTALRATTEIIVGTAARTIVEYAADNGYDLIVMGTHGRTGLAHVLVGSVAEHVVRSAHCPVLTVHTRLEQVALPVSERKVAAATT
ncbi:MAG: universal stress protein [Acidimicrobiia bacterium]|nr:universal stress protein [Acidimicrobiia bacterium]